MCEVYDVDHVHVTMSHRAVVGQLCELQGSFCCFPLTASFTPLSHFRLALTILAQIDDLLATYIAYIWPAINTLLLA